ncbi:sigma-70 family RNA polymerase sigma factor [Catellatospora bangladeshensis]|uniref:Sigma-70 family RNA polymerase sigma factor n=1 Tax=Catellatospora bangladeshensis TaxID=310355 RepID=A0A8J3NIT3_9ACTN|nr:sigma-70 family RNA polymerase sigma factor [Catellatospora bangladeshensis]GIF82765.1 hypothetical protein Cba03nite_41140 [Catellatospora bangladeshensis]
MPSTSTGEAALVTAAQAGDRRALAALLETYLPFAYTIVRRALGSGADVDDVVQETMLRAVRELRELRDPHTFRAWLGTIAVRQVSTHLQRRRTAEPYTGGELDDLIETADAGASFEGLTMLRLDVAAQRRQAARAAQWLDDDDRVLLSLWWLEVAGRLSRTELAAAAGVSVAHAGVRVQRLRQQLEQCRALLAALDGRPRCPELESVAAGWDGTPGSAWRKRLTRHVRDCATCAGAAGGLVAAEQLLTGFALLPVPVALTAAVLGKGAVTGTSSVTLAAKAGVLGNLAKTFAASPIAATAVTGSVVAAAAVAAIAWPSPSPAPPPSAVAPQPPAVTTPAALPPSPSPSRTRPAPSATPRPSPAPAAPLTTGPFSLEAGGEPGLFATTADGLAVLAPLSAASGADTRATATFQAVSGLADAKCFSFRASDGRYLRHSSWRLRLDPAIDTELFRGDATFCVRPGPSAGTVLLEASNYPGWFMHRRGTQLWVDHSDGSAAFQAESAFRVRPPLAG